MNARGARIVVMDGKTNQMHVTTTDVPYPTTTDEDAWAEFQAETEPIAYDTMRATLPPVERRSPQQHWEAMFNRILPDMLRAYRETGHMPAWPASLEAVLVYLAERDHEPTLLEDHGVEGVIRQARAFVTFLAEQGVRKQAEQDSKKVTLDWSGH